MRVSKLAPLALALVASGCQAAPENSARTTMGLMSTLPLYWGEAGDVGEVLGGEAKPAWVRQALEERFVLEPLDVLTAEKLAGLATLVLAQPRALSADENVALDGWVRGGGRLLLFADPLLTGHSRFAIGDKRRPQDVVLLSPILAHWGLELSFDEAQPPGERVVEFAGVPVPVVMAGQFRAAPGAQCVVSAGSVLAQCRIGRGRVTALADAAVLDEPEDAALPSRRRALAALLEPAFR